MFRTVCLAALLAAAIPSAWAAEDAGFCPGPALASLAAGGIKPLIFSGAMLAGMATFELLERRGSVGGERAHGMPDQQGDELPADHRQQEKHHQLAESQH